MSHTVQCPVLHSALDSLYPLNLYHRPLPTVQMMKLRLREAKCSCE